MIKKIALILCLCLMLTGCKKDKSAEKFSTQIFAMDTVMEILIYGQDDSVLKKANSLVSDLDQSLSTTNQNSEIYQLNVSGSAALSENTALLMKKGLEFCQKTSGALDLSIYPVVQAWGFTTDEYRIPSEESLNTLLQNVDYTKISLQDDYGTIPEGMAVDLGSIAKGFTGDLLAEEFKNEGISSALLNLGGNVHALGSKPDGSPWKVGIQDPISTDYLGVLSIRDQAVITSGGYERYFEGPDGEIYWHIIDPATGKPAKSGLISATAVGSEGVYCDALSTSLFIMGEEKATQFWKENKDFQMILVTENKEVLITPGLQNAFHLTQDAPYTLRVIGND